VGTLGDGSTVRLQRADGRYIRVALQRLSLADQQIVAAATQTIASNW
jgi:hypothetical protein